MKKLLTLIASFGLFLALAGSASAHVVVTPATVGIASEQTFNISVPSEREGLSTISIRLVVPAGVTDVMPTQKLGWTVHTIGGEGEGGEATEATSTQIMWTGGRIPAGQRDDFSFSAQVPGKAGTIVWKAYQTYSDGSVVSYDVAPNGEDVDDDSAPTGPSSITTVVDDLTPVAKKVDLAPWAFGISLLALLVALYSSIEHKQKNHK